MRAILAAMFSERVKLLGTEGAFRISPHIAEVEARGTRVIRCNIGEPDFPLPAHIAQELKAQIDAGNTHYVEPQGLLSLRRAVAARMERRGIPADADRVVIFPGAKTPIGLAQE